MLVLNSRMTDLGLILVAKQSEADKAGNEHKDNPRKRIVRHVSDGSDGVCSQGKDDDAIWRL